MQHPRRVLAAVLTAAVLVAGTDGCADGGGSDPGDTNIFRSSEPEPRAEPPSGSAADEPASAASALPDLPAPGVPPAAERDRAGLPPGLVGGWQSADEFAALRYRFTPGGGYAHAGVIEQERMTGRFHFAVTESGWARVRGGRLVLTPTRAHQVMRDPDAPESNVDGPASLDVTAFGWRLVDGRLLLTPRTGATVTYTRE